MKSQLRVLATSRAFYLGISALLLIYLVGVGGPFLIGALYSQCSFSSYLTIDRDAKRTDREIDVALASMRIIDRDDALSLVRVQTRTRPFWIRQEGKRQDGPHLLAYVQAEQIVIDAAVPAQSVQPGQVVVDVGAHVGTFGDHALRRGAARVVMVEPDPVNVECLRRNFAAEISAGRVIVIPQGAWSSEQMIEFSTGVGNSGMGSMVTSETGAKHIQVPVRRLDSILADAHIDRVDFIKMDIEGAEREALAGASSTLARFKPRLMLDAYHRPDDPTVLPQVIKRANPAYREVCGTCTAHGNRSTSSPHVIFFE